MRNYFIARAFSSTQYNMSKDLKNYLIQDYKLYFPWKCEEANKESGQNKQQKATRVTAVFKYTRR